MILILVNRPRGIMQNRELSWGGNRLRMQKGAE